MQVSSERLKIAFSISCHYVPLPSPKLGTLKASLRYERYSTKVATGIHTILLCQGSWQRQGYYDVGGQLGDF